MVKNTLFLHLHFTINQFFVVFMGPLFHVHALTIARKIEKEKGCVIERTWNPGKHWHLKLPTVLVQVAKFEQGLNRHSLTSLTPQSGPPKPSSQTHDGSEDTFSVLTFTLYKNLRHSEQIWGVLKNTFWTL